MSLKALKASQPPTDKWVLLTCPEFASVAKDLLKRVPNEMEGAWIEWKVFPDGTPNLRFDAESVEGRDVILLGSLDLQNLLPLMSIIYAVPRCLARSFTVILPFFPTGTMERVETEGEVATAKTLARMLSATPSPNLGETTFVVFDIHALATRFYFSDTVKIQLVTAVPLLFKEIALLEATEGVKPVIAFPDEGAKKRFSIYFASKFDMILCIKTRVGDKRELVLQEGNPVGRHVIVVDDLIQSGGTLLSCKDLLYAKGAAKVSAFAVHAVFPKESWKSFLTSNTPKGKRPFHHVFVSDSVPKVAQVLQGKSPFKILSLAERLAELIQAPLASARRNPSIQTPVGLNHSKL
jgi:ribose-phosphate pyrophosphokinase